MIEKESESVSHSVVSDSWRPHGLYPTSIHGILQARILERVAISFSKFLLHNIQWLIIFLIALGLCCCVQAFSSGRTQGLLSSCGAWASHCSGFSYCRAQVLGPQAS